MSNIAIITAKGRSRRLPGKNIRPFFGKPILTYPIQAALASGLFDTVMVSTDDPDIARIATAAGAEAPFLRSAETSSDDAMLYEVAEEVIRQYQQMGREFEFICCMLPTAVFISPEQLKKAFEQLQANPEAEGVFTVVRFSDPIQRALQLDAKGQVSMVWPENLHIMSNDLPPRFHDGGQFWWIKTHALLTQHKLYPDHALGLEVPESEAVDLDTEEDWIMAELKFQRFRQKHCQSVNG